MKSKFMSYVSTMCGNLFVGLNFLANSKNLGNERWKKFMVLDFYGVKKPRKINDARFHDVSSLSIIYFSMVYCIEQKCLKLRMHEFR